MSEIVQLVQEVKDTPLSIGLDVHGIPPEKAADYIARSTNVLPINRGCDISGLSKRESDMLLAAFKQAVKTLIRNNSSFTANQLRQAFCEQKGISKSNLSIADKQLEQAYRLAQESGDAELRLYEFQSVGAEFSPLSRPMRDSEEQENRQLREKTSPLSSKFIALYKTSTFDPGLVWLTTEAQMKNEQDLINWCNLKPVGNVSYPLEEVVQGIEDICSAAGVHKLSDEQFSSVVSALTQNVTTHVIEGAAGAGKSTSMYVLAELYRQRGWNVKGISLSWVATDILAADTGEGDYKAIATLIKENEEIQTIENNTLFIMDEGGQTAIQQMAAFYSIVNAAIKDGKNVKVIITGESAQLNPVGGANALDLVKAVLPIEQSSRITNIFRQKNELDRDVVRLLRNRETEKATRIMYASEFFRLTNKNDELLNLVVNDYIKKAAKSYQEHRDFRDAPLLVTGSNVAVQDLNERIISAIQKNSPQFGGMLSPLKMSKPNQGVTVSIKYKNPISVVEQTGLDYDYKEVTFFVGAKIITTSKLKGFDDDGGVVNSKTKAMITGFKTKPDGGVVIDCVRDDKTLSKFSIDVDKELRDFQLPISFNFASTAYSSQGKTVKDCMYVLDGMTDARYAYIIGSRHTENLTIYASKESLGNAKSEMIDSKAIQEIAKKWMKKNDRPSLVVAGAFQTFKKLKERVRGYEETDLTDTQISALKRVVDASPFVESEISHLLKHSKEIFTKDSVNRDDEGWAILAAKRWLNQEGESVIDLDESKGEIVTPKNAGRFFGLSEEKMEVYGSFFGASRFGDKALLLCHNRDGVIASRYETPVLIKPKTFQNRFKSSESEGFPSPYNVKNVGDVVDLHQENYPFYIPPVIKGEGGVSFEVDKAEKVLFFESLAGMLSHVNSGKHADNELLLLANADFMQSAHSNKTFMQELVGIKEHGSFIVIPDNQGSVYEKLYKNKIDDTMGILGISTYDTVEVANISLNSLSYANEDLQVDSFLSSLGEQNLDVDELPEHIDEIRESFWEQVSSADYSTYLAIPADDDMPVDLYFDGDFPEQSEISVNKSIEESVEPQVKLKSYRLKDLQREAKESRLDEDVGVEEGMIDYSILLKQMIESPSSANTAQEVKLPMPDEAEIPRNFNEYMDL